MVRQIVGDQNPTLLGRDFEEQWISNTSETSLVGV